MRPYTHRQASAARRARRNTLPSWSPTMPHPKHFRHVGPLRTLAALVLLSLWAMPSPLLWADVDPPSDPIPTFTLSPAEAPTGLFTEITLLTDEPLPGGSLTVGSWTLDPLDGDAPATEHRFRLGVPWDAERGPLTVSWTTTTDDDALILEADDPLVITEGAPPPQLLILEPSEVTAGTIEVLTLQLTEHPLPPSEVFFGEIEADVEALDEGTFLLTVHVPLDALERGGTRDLDIRWEDDLLPPYISTDSIQVLGPVPVILGAEVRPSVVFQGDEATLEIAILFEDEAFSVPASRIQIPGIIDASLPPEVEPGVWRFTRQIGALAPVGDFLLLINFQDNRLPPLQIPNALTVSALPPAPSFGGLTPAEILAGESTTVRVAISTNLTITDVRIGDLVTSWERITPGFLDPYNVLVEVETSTSTPPGGRSLVVTFDHPRRTELRRNNVFAVVAPPPVSTEVVSIDPTTVVAGTDTTVTLRLQEPVVLESIQLGTFPSTFRRDDEDPTLWYLDLSVPPTAARRGYTLTLTQEDARVEPKLISNAIEVVSPPAGDWQLSPSTALRGGTRELTLAGPDIGDLQEVEVLNEGVGLVDLQPLASDRIRLRVQVSDNAALGPVDLLLRTSGGQELRDDLLTVTPGPVSLLSVVPNRITPGADPTTVELRGRNLDTIDAITSSSTISAVFGEGGTPTRRPLILEAAESTPPGRASLTATSGSVPTTLVDALLVERPDLRFSSVSPEAVERGDTVEIVLEGIGLDAVDQITAAGRVVVQPPRERSDDRLLVEVFVREDAVLGFTPLLAIAGGDIVDTGLTLDILPEPSSLRRLVPSRIYREEEGLLLIEGRSLDGVTAVRLGEGIEVLSFEAELPNRLAIRYQVDADAVLGFRDVELDSTHGDIRALDRLQVGDVRLPPPSIEGTFSLNLEPTEVGALRLATLTFTNTGEVEETLTLEDPSGDIDLLHFTDPERPTEVRTSEVLTLAPGESAELTVRYAPVFRAQSAASYQLMGREGEALIDQIVLRGESVTRTHLFNPTPPLRFGPWPAEERRALPDLLLDAAEESPAINTRVLSVRVLLRFDGEPITAAQAGMDLLLDASPPHETPLWNDAQLTWATAVRTGLLEGTLLFETDSERAPLIAYPFSIRGTEDPVADDDVSTPRPDVGTDVEADTDMPWPEDSDRVEDDGPIPSDGGDGCCAIGGGAPPYGESTLALLALLLLRRKRAA